MSTNRTDEQNQFPSDDISIPDISNEMEAASHQAEEEAQGDSSHSTLRPALSRLTDVIGNLNDTQVEAVKLCYYARCGLDPTTLEIGKESLKHTADERNKRMSHELSMRREMRFGAAAYARNGKVKADLRRSRAEVESLQTRVQTLTDDCKYLAEQHVRVKGDFDLIMSITEKADAELLKSILEVVYESLGYQFGRNQD
ncbi:hypothetical protein CC80DRAFT_532063 [Byssothecium circinans]|uniref:Uncharacterized protein n=1 Tax=Byssothecium circinans TaxID=147558 RepID=A0A6A5UK19_9PLEO|nr:hypothetical protein CC80DRAFT_532063 [Byssothecium circinans]